MHTQPFPPVLPMRERAGVIREILEERLRTVLPAAMRESGLDMWIILCQEDDLDPIFKTLIPMDAWCPILQMLVFHDRGDEIEGINLSMTNTGGLYEKPWQGRDHEEQWPLLAQLVQERNPQRIGINTGAVQWAAGGLTQNLHRQLVEALGPDLAARLESAEPLVTRWAANLSEGEVALYEHVVAVAHAILADCYSSATIIPGLTTTADLEWHYWQRVADLGLEIAFKPFFDLVRSPAAKEQFGPEDNTVRPGDVIHSDVGIRYLGLNSDHQQLAYVLRPGETDAPDGLKALLAHAHRLQDIFMSEFEAGLSGNELLANILNQARETDIPGPRIYSHSLGHFLHQPGPLIGLPWEQECCPGRGDVILQPNNSFTMELCVSGAVPEWGPGDVTFSVEEDVVFTTDGCRLVDGRQTEFALI